MTKKPSFSLSARNFRIILWIIVGLLVAAGIGLFLYSHQQLSSYAQQVGEKQKEADASRDSLQQLQTLQHKLKDLRDLQPLLDQLSVQADLPQFRAKDTLEAIAKQAGVPISGISFQAAGGTGSATTPSAPATTPAPTAPAPATSGTGKTTTISFEISQPISYEKLLLFLHAIETSSPKLQIDAVRLSEESTRAAVNPGTLTIEMATR